MRLHASLESFESCCTSASLLIVGMHCELLGDILFCHWSMSGYLSRSVRTPAEKATTEAKNLGANEQSGKTVLIICTTHGIFMMHIQQYQLI